MTTITDTAPPKPRSTGPSRCCGFSLLPAADRRAESSGGLFSLTDRAAASTLDNFIRSLTDARFLDPLLTTAIIAIASGIGSCVVATPIGWLVARTDMPWRRTVRALIMASFVTPPFLGAIAWEIWPHPTAASSTALSRPDRRRTDLHLFNIYSVIGLAFVIGCYTFPTSSSWSRTRSTASRPSSRTPPRSSAAAPRPRHGASRSRWSCRRCWPARWSRSCRP